MARTLLVIDDDFVADALDHLLGPHEWGKAQRAADLDTAETMLARQRPDLVTLDLQVARSDALPFLERVTDEHPHLPVVVFTGVETPEAAVASIRAGALAFVPKSTPPEQVIDALLSVLAGNTWLPAGLLGPVLDRLINPPPPSEWHLLVNELSPREREVLELMVAGLSRRSIADQLTISLNTVRTHVKNILSCLGVHSSLEAVSLALRAGIRPPMAEAD